MIVRRNPDPAKEINRLLGELHARGLLEDRSGRKHKKYFIKGIGNIITASTPSDPRSTLNELSTLRRKLSKAVADGVLPKDFPIRTKSSNPPKVTAVLKKLNKGPKKYKMVFTRVDGKKKKTIRFGDSSKEDFTIHKDHARRRRYIIRHETRENWKDPMTAGALSRWLLWNKPSLRESVWDFQLRFGIPVKIESTFRAKDIRRSNPANFEFRPSQSPLQYTSQQVERIALCDPGVVTPPSENDYYFAHVRKVTNYSTKGTRLKRPKVEIIPGVDDNCVVAFLDYHSLGNGHYYIDYVKTRSDQRNKGYAEALIDHFYQSVPDAKTINWGDILHPAAHKILEVMQVMYPNVSSFGTDATGYSK